MKQTGRSVTSVAMRNGRASLVPQLMCDVLRPEDDGGGIRVALTMPCGESLGSGCSGALRHPGHPELGRSRRRVGSCKVR